jgi:hypothetical protein
MDYMPQLTWDEADFLACLDVEPTIDEYEAGYHYSVVKDGLRLELAVFQFSSDICISVYRDSVERPIISFTITECNGTRFVKDKRGEFLEFAPSQVFGDRFQRDFVIPLAFDCQLSRASISRCSLCPNGQRIGVRTVSRARRVKRHKMKSENT